MWKHSLCIDCAHKIIFLSHFGLIRMYIPNFYYNGHDMCKTEVSNGTRAVKKKVTAPICFPWDFKVEQNPDIDLLKISEWRRTKRSKQWEFEQIGQLVQELWIFKVYVIFHYGNPWVGISASTCDVHCKYGDISIGLYT